MNYQVIKKNIVTTKLMIKSLNSFTKLLGMEVALIVSTHTTPKLCNWFSVNVDTIIVLVNTKY
jgi:hypothetical protein